MENCLTVQLQIFHLSWQQKCNLKNSSHSQPKLFLYSQSIDFYTGLHTRAHTPGELECAVIIVIFPHRSMLLRPPTGRIQTDSSIQTSLAGFDTVECTSAQSTHWHLWRRVCVGVEYVNKIKLLSDKITRHPKRVKITTKVSTSDNWIKLVQHESHHNIIWSVSHIIICEVSCYRNWVGSFWFLGGWSLRMSVLVELHVTTLMQIR